MKIALVTILKYNVLMLGRRKISLILSLSLFLMILPGCSGTSKKVSNENTPFIPMSIDEESTTDLSPHQKLLKKLQLRKRNHYQQQAKSRYVARMKELARSGAAFDTTARVEIQGLFNDFRRFDKSYQKSLKSLNDFEYKRYLLCMKQMKKIIKVVKKLEKKRDRRIRKLHLKRWSKETMSYHHKPCPDKGKIKLIYRGGRRFLACSVHGLYGKKKRKKFSRR